MADWALSRSYFFPRLTPLYHPFFYEPRPAMVPMSFFDIDDAISRMHQDAARQMVEVFKDFDTLTPRPRERAADWMDVDDEEFFKDIEHPFALGEETKGQKSLKGETAAAAEPEPAPGEEEQTQAQEQQQRAQGEQQQQEQQQPSTRSSRYVYSSTTIRNEKGEPITREFKHYEDSTGRAKTWRRRAIGDKAIPEVYQKFPGKENVEKKQLADLNENERQEFEKNWQETPFAKLQQQQMEGQQQEGGQTGQKKLEGQKQKGQGHHKQREHEKERAKMEL